MQCDAMCEEMGTHREIMLLTRLIVSFPTEDSGRRTDICPVRVGRLARIWCDRCIGLVRGWRLCSLYQAKRRGRTQAVFA